MLLLSPQSVIWMASDPVDFRKGIEGLMAIVRQKFCKDPYDGAIFLFYNKLRTTIKIITFDGQGCWLCMKRLSTGKFQKTTLHKNPTSALIQSLDYRSLYILMNNGDPKLASCSKNWRSPAITPP